MALVSTPLQCCQMLGISRLLQCLLFQLPPRATTGTLASIAGHFCRQKLPFTAAPYPPSLPTQNAWSSKVNACPALLRPQSSRVPPRWACQSPIGGGCGAVGRHERGVRAAAVQLAAPAAPAALREVAPARARELPEVREHPDARGHAEVAAPRLVRAAEHVVLGCGKR